MYLYFYFFSGHIYRIYEFGLFVFTTQRTSQTNLKPTAPRQLKMVALNVVFEPEIVALAAGMAFWGCYTAVSLMEQYRLSTTRDNRKSSLVVLALVSATLGGVAIWSLHFVAACSFHLELDGVKIPVRYNTGLVITALIVNIVVQFISIYIGSTDPCFNKSKKEIMESFIARASNTYSIAQIRNIGKYKLLFLLCTHNIERVVFGGCLSGVGCVVVILLGFMSMEFQGTITSNPGLVVLVIILACFFATNAFVAFARVLSIFPSMDSMRLGMAFNSLFFMTGYHYLALNSVEFEYDATIAPPSAHNTVSESKLLVGVLAAAMVFCGIMLIFVLADLRAWLLTTSTQLRQADMVIDALYQQTRSLERNAAHNEMLRYVRRYNRLPTANSATNSDTSDPIPYMRRTSLYNDYSDDEVSGSTIPYNVNLDGTTTPVLYQRKKPAPQSESSSAGRSAVYLSPEEPTLHADIEQNAPLSSIFNPNNENDVNVNTTNVGRENNVSSNAEP